MEFNNDLQAQEAEVRDYEDDLQKTEVELANARAKLAKNAEGWASFVRQLKEKYDKGMIMDDLFRLQEDMVQRPATRPTGAVVEALMEREESDVNLKEELHKLIHQMAEMYRAWMKGHPPPSYPANPDFVPPLAQSQEPPAVDSFPGFPHYHHYQGTTSQTTRAPPAKPIPYPPPLTTPIFVAPPPATLHRSSSESLFQTQDNRYYRPEPTFKAPDHYSYTPRFDLLVETKNPPKTPEQEEMFRKVRSLEQSFRNMQGLGGQVSVAYKDLCLFPDVQFPVGFKMPKFDMYDGHEDSVAHLRGFCSKMRGAGRKDELLMAYFNQSLSGAVFEWYTHQDHSRWEYGFRWREQVARVNPPMEESEMVEYFLQALEPTYFIHLISAIGKSFNEVVKMGGMVEEGIKSSKIMSYSAIKTTTQAIQKGTGGVIGKKKKEDMETELIDTNRIEVQTPEAPKINQNPWPTHEETNMIDIVHKGGAQEAFTIRYDDSASEVKLVKKPMVEGSVNKLSMTNGKPSVVVDKRSPSNVVAKQEKSKVVMPGLANKPVIIVEGARMDPVVIKPGLTRSGRCFAPEELRKAKTSRDNPVLIKKAITKEEAEEFFRKLKVQDYSIVEQLRKMPAHISLLSLLIHSDEHRRALMKILNEAHVPNKISVNHLEKIANKIFEGLVDNGSSANICPFSTLNKLKVDDERIHKNSICVRGFDGGGKDSIGDIVLELTIGLVEFTMEFQVLDIAVSYNLLLGRPWIHAAKAVTSTLRQMVKFEWDR
ncbi:uncharacterized protein [Nicotiana sylvestris]|uniref:uncharacterized protein n=1 Tax=Nicotiana sylvestris TaxID=4096 RepID=UPI00388C9E9D